MSATHAVEKNTTFKRQKLRKGTFSCWECKNRKIRCEYEPSTDPVCNSCQRRGLPCRSQEYIEVDGNGYEHARERIDHIEGMVNQLLTRRKGTISSSEYSRTSQAKYSAGQREMAVDRRKRKREISACHSRVVSRLRPSVTSTSQQSLNGCMSISHYLHSILPKEALTLIIFTQGNYFQTPSQLLRRPKKPSVWQDKPGGLLMDMAKKPPPTAHPIIFAQKLYRIALCLQRLDPSISYETTQTSTETVADASRRFVHIASTHVTSHDNLVESLDGLDTLILEAGYYINIGEIHAAWRVLRRALGIAELMGLRKRNLDGDDDQRESTWYLLNYCDRFLSVMYGLPCNSSDNSFATERVLAGKTPVERLARTHLVIIGHIIERNFQVQSCSYNSFFGNALIDAHEHTQGIDNDLKQAAKILPVNLWVMPSLCTSAADSDLMEKTSLLHVQLHQYYLLLLLHQPYLLQQLCSHDITDYKCTIDYTYSKFTALSASRELLCRFLSMRNFHHTISYRGVDQKAWIASITLLLGHIDTHNLHVNNDALVHLRLQDLALIHRVLHRFDKDSFTTESVQQLRSLLLIEEESAKGAKYCFIWGDNGNLTLNLGDLELSIPYFGKIFILSTLTLEKFAPCNEATALQAIDVPDPRLVESETRSFFNSVPEISIPPRIFNSFLGATSGVSSSTPSLASGEESLLFSSTEEMPSSNRL